MTNKVDIKRLDSVTKNDTTATEQINDNFLALQAAIENTLSRDGTGPNFMDADLDMNSYRIINSSDPVEDNDIVNLKYVEERIGGAVEASKTAVSAATQAANSAQSALVSSTNAINTLRNAENTINLATSLLTETQEYVDNAKADIDSTVEAGKEEINTTIDDAQMSLSDTIQQSVEEVKQAALDAANEAINDAAATATGIVVEYANNEIKPLLNEIASNAAESAENASESAGLAANESANAAISATDSQHYAEDSRIWAEGSDSEVKNVDGEHSSKVWSEMAKTSATSAASSADLARQYSNDKINQTHITNCITEIPQDIKLELNNGTLTLKAGSKVYVPRTNNEFLEVTISNDLSYTYSAVSAKPKLFYNLTTNSIFGETNTGSGSGINPPQAYYTYYDVDLNVVRRSVDGSTWIGDELSLPLCDMTSTQGTGITSIDQVFNGFGYIGSTVFALPNVKGLIPNGRNADGSLRNIEFITDRVLVDEAADTETRPIKILLYPDKIESWGADARNIMYYKTRPDVAPVTFCTAYIEDENKWIRSTETTEWVEELICADVGDYQLNNSNIVAFYPKLPFRAVDYNDSSWVSAQAMPSGKYIDLTLGASGSSYTAPANGWFTVSAWTTATATSYIHLVNTSNELAILLTPHQGAVYQQRCFIPAKKGDVVKLAYGNLDTSHSNFKFIYAEGEN